MPTVNSAPDASPPARRGRPPKTVAERDEGNRRQLLIAAAARLFRTKGFDGTSTRDIAAAADMQSGSPFYFFQSKQALLHAVMQEGMARVTVTQAATLKALGARANAHDKLRALHRSGQIKAKPDAARLLIFGALHWAVQWYSAKGPLTLDDITAQAMALFTGEA